MEDPRRDEGSAARLTAERFLTKLTMMLARYLSSLDAARPVPLALNAAAVEHIGAAVEGTGRTAAAVPSNSQAQENNSVG